MGYQEWDKKKLLQNGDKVIVTVPVVGHSITINEIHAFQMGLTGIFFGMAYASDLPVLPDVTVALAVIVVTYAIVGNPAFKSLNMDDPAYKTIGMKTIRHEPWWFITPFIALFLVGMLL